MARAAREHARPDGMSNRAETSMAAWDGTTSMRGHTIPTYSDDALRPWGPSLHFCFNDADLRDPVRGAIPRLARLLRAEKPLRVVIVGHGDHQGTCRYNDGLALRRAQTARHALIRAGLRAATVQAASLGERRPLDFASSDSAHALNRRVEILVEREVNRSQRR
jgi:outer membrane protein OmpA-like peptidoglycan-associated protein